MAELTLLRPQILNGVIQQIPVPETFAGSALFKRNAYPFTTVTYDVIKSTLDTATPNVPGAPAHLVGNQQIGQVSYGMLYVREKKSFDPVTMYWLRALGQIGNAQKYAEDYVRRELENLNMRLERFVERTIWQALTTGKVQFNTAEVKATIDFQVSASHIITKSTNTWDSSAAPIIQDVTDYKQTFVHDAHTPVETVFATSKTLSLLARNDAVRQLMSNEQRGQYFATGNIPGLLGLNWVAYDSAYVDEAGTQQTYIPDGMIVMLSTANDNFEVLEGPSADAKAQGASGKFAKTWQEEDPSAIQSLVEYTFGPKITRPDQLLIVQVAPSNFQ